MMSNGQNKLKKIFTYRLIVYIDPSRIKPNQKGYLARFKP